MTVDLSILAGLDLDALRAAVHAEQARRSFLEFVRQAWHVLEPNGRPFMRSIGTDAIIDHLQAVGDGQIRRLLIAISPGFGKSTLASVAFPAWMWARSPAWRAICASHTYSLAVQLGQRFRRVIESDWYRAAFGLELVTERIDALENSATGRRFATGVGGALTGFRGDCGIIDDSLNAIDATSETAIATANEWFDTALSNRLDRGDVAPIVVIQQVLAENDLIGHLRARGGWEELVLPAEFDPARRCVTSIWRDPREVKGELLAPQLQSQAYLDEQKVTLGSYGYAKQFQQLAAPQEGGRIKRAWCRFFRLHETDAPVRARPHGCDGSASLVIGRKASGDLDLDWIDVSVDATFGALTDKADAVGLLIVGGKGQRRFVFDDASKPRGFGESVAAIRDALVRSGARRVLIEKKANGAAIIEQLTTEIAAGQLKDARGRTMLAKVEPIEPEGGKASRAAAMEPAIEAGMVHLLDGAPWLEAFVGEHAMFPAGAHDDRVDALSQVMIFHADAALDRARALLGVGRAIAGGR